MSEPQTKAGNESLFSATVKGEKAEDFESQFADLTEPEVEEAAPEVEEEVVVEDSEVVSEEAADETDADRLVRETTEALHKRAKEATVPPPAVDPAVSVMEGRIQELKDQVVQMGRARQEVDEPDEGFDASILDSPEIQSHLQAARESDDPTAEAKALSLIAQHVYKQQGNDEVVALRQELDALKEGSQREVRRQQNQQMFVAGLDAAEAVGEVERSLVQQFKQTRELEHWNAHLASAGNLNDYTPKSLLGVWLMNKPQFATTPELMQAGTMLLARELGAAGQAGAAEVSTTGAGARASVSKAGKEMENPTEKTTPEDEVLQGILAANERRKGKPAAFQR